MTKDKEVVLSIRLTREILNEFANTLKKARRGKPIRKHVGISFESIDGPDTVRMVEKVLKNAEMVISEKELQRRLPKRVTHQALNSILNYLEEKGFIAVGSKGVLWVHNDSPKLKKLIEQGTEI